MRKPKSVRVYPPMWTRIISLLLIVSGVVGILVCLVIGQWIAAVVCALLPLLGASMVRWVEVGEHQFTERRLLGDTNSVRFEDVREVGIGMHQVRKTKWWYPEISTLDGSSVKFESLRSRSGTRTIARVEEIFQACKSRLPEVTEEVPIEAITVGEDGELQFVAAGYETYLREKAREESEASAANASMPAPEPEVVEPAAPAPRLTIAVESPPDIGEIDEEPDVFEPAPLIAKPKKKRSHLSVVPDLAPPPIPAAPPTVIEQPTEVFGAPRKSDDAADRNFTSLFRRAA